MEFVCSQSELNSNLSLVSRAVPSRPTHPILGNVLVVVDADKGRVSLTAFDLSLGIETSFSADVNQGGKIALPAKLLNDLVSRLPEGKITLITNKDNLEDDTQLIILKSASGQFQLQAMSAEEFPELPTVEGGDTLKLPIAILTEGLKGSLFAASSDEAKQVLTGVHVAGNLDGLEFAATDGHRLAVVKTPLQTEIDGEEEVQRMPEGDFARFAVTIPARALRELERMFANRKSTDTVALYVDDAQIVFELGEQRLTSRKLDGIYPSYNQLIPLQFARTVSLDRKRFISSLERVAVLADQRNNLVKCTIDEEKGQVSLSVEAQGLGKAKESIPAQITGESGDVAFNVKYLMDGLKALPTKEFQMQLNAGNQPVILTPLGGIKMIYLVMPVQLI
ncbi:MAG: DNA polymerase III subunit beta [cyanobacterium endosymbiont of Rhopalodia musculus]|uniref:DNA polymerase III subunit beta n=1 Tax=cyanobacterium endosymbiont of Epithemia clementina EcSB TaxID=3034674 RepID=UPI0024802109|nr:DNA polymerase III subunit beta [cyanobacterium endosymbiont of Epithemia clementina EcSB]WGT67515.1 DNA polymerase III subunit beta [cyanobacterium endosymbiont of Epithemia clementina EcSB]